MQGEGRPEEIKKAPGGGRLAQSKGKKKVQLCEEKRLYSISLEITEG